MTRNLFEDMLTKEKVSKEVDSNENFDLNDLKKYSINTKLVEETHKRATFLIENNVLEEFNELCKNEKRGFKTKAINMILKDFLSKY